MNEKEMYVGESLEVIYDGFPEVGMSVHCKLTLAKVRHGKVTVELGRAWIESVHVEHGTHEFVVARAEAAAEWDRTHGRPT